MRSMLFSSGIGDENPTPALPTESSYFPKVSRKTREIGIKVEQEFHGLVAFSFARGRNRVSNKMGNHLFYPV